jgi:hypothetical protein
MQEQVFEVGPEGKSRLSQVKHVVAEVEHV